MRFRLDTLSGSAQTMVTNNAAFDIFLRSNNKEELSIALKWMQLIPRKNIEMIPIARILMRAYCINCKGQQSNKNRKLCIKNSNQFRRQGKYQIIHSYNQGDENGDKIWYDKERFEN